MKFDPEFLTSTTGQWVLLAVALVIGTGTVAWQHQRKQTELPAVEGKPSPATMPQVFERTGARFPAFIKPTEPATKPQPVMEPAPVLPAVDTTLRTPLSLFAASDKNTQRSPELIAPYGRLIPCETVVTLESNQLTTPVIGLITADVWENGTLLIPAGTEVHGRASLDRTRERIAVEGRWVLVWRTRDSRNGTQLTVQGLALDRTADETGSIGMGDGSAGLRGTVIKTDDHRELRLFAATFLSAATAALQDTRVNTGPWGESSVPATTARNATLAGSGAVLREYAEQIRESIARDGFFLRVPAGTPFYLYVTERLDLGKTQRATHNPDLS